MDQVTKFDSTTLGKGQSFFGTVSSRVYGVGEERPPFFAEPKNKAGPSRAIPSIDGKPPLSKLSSLASGAKPSDNARSSVSDEDYEKEMEEMREQEKERDEWLKEQNRLIEERRMARTAASKPAVLSEEKIKRSPVSTMPSDNSTLMTEIEMIPSKVKEDQKDPVQEDRSLVEERRTTQTSESSNAVGEDVNILKDDTENERELELLRLKEAERDEWLKKENELIEERRLARIAQEEKMKVQKEKLLAAMKAKKSKEEERLREEIRIAEESKFAAEVEMRLMEEAKVAREEQFREELRLAELERQSNEKKIKEDIHRMEREKLAREKELKEEMLAEEKRLAEIKRLAEESRRSEEAQAAALKAANDRQLQLLEDKLEEMKRTRLLEESKLVKARQIAELAKAEEESRVAAEKVEAERQLKVLEKQLELKSEAEKKLESIRSKALEKKKEDQEIWLKRQRELAEKIEKENRLTEEAIAAAKKAEAELKQLEEKERKEAREREAAEKQLKEVKSRIAEQKKKEEDIWKARQKELAERIAEENRLTQEAILAAEKAEAELQQMMEDQEGNVDTEERTMIDEESLRKIRENIEEERKDGSSPSSVDILSSIHDIGPIHSVVAAAPIPESERSEVQPGDQKGRNGTDSEIPTYDTFSRGAKIPTAVGNAQDDQLDSSSPLATDVEALELVALCQASFDPKRPTIDFTSSTAAADAYAKYFNQYDTDDVSNPDDDMCLMPSEYPFVSLLRDSSPYIVNHRQSTIVYHIPGDLISDKKKFNSVMDDIALTWLFGMKIIICVGCRKQVIERLERMHISSTEGSTIDGVSLPGVRVTSPETLRVLEEEAGFCRFEVERQLNRCLRNKGADCNVVSGCFVTAKKFGVVDGVDYQFTGYPTALQKDKIHRFHSRNDVVLLTPLGFSKQGDALNIHSEALAAFTAGALEASKIVFFSNSGMVMRDDDNKQRVQMIRRSNAKQILSHHGLTINGATGFPRWNRPAFVDRENSAESMRRIKEQHSWLLKVGWATHALERGVERAHIVTCDDGALLEELFTARRGYGTCISQDDFMSPHPQDWNDDVAQRPQY